MSDYKLISFEPTPEMVEAAEDAYMPFGDMDLAIRMAILAAPAVQGEPGVKWAPEEVANGNKGIRWVSDEGVHGRPTDHDCRVYLESNPNARGCHCPECTMLYAAPQPAEQKPAPDVEGPINVSYTDGNGAVRSRPADCRYGVSYVTVADTVYWPLSAEDAQRLLSAGCGRGDFTGPGTSPDVEGLVGKVRMLIAAGNRLNAEAQECTYDDGTAEVASVDFWSEFRDALEAATEALAAHRKKGGNDV